MRATQILARAVTCNPNGEATLCNGRVRTWREVGARVPRIAAGLRGLGVQDGVRVAVLAMNSDRFVELFFATPWAGGVIVPLNIRWSALELQHALEDSKPSLLLVDDAFQDLGRELQSRIASITTVVHIGEGDCPDGLVDYETVCAVSEPMPEAVREGDDAYVVFYTGGTTGRSKGVVMSHRAVAAAAVMYLAVLPMIDDMRYAHISGFFHVGGTTPLWYTTMAGGAHVLLPKYETGALIHAIQTHRVTNVTLTPVMVGMLMAHPDCAGADLSSLRTCVYGGSPMVETLMTEAARTLPTWSFVQIYGMTETCGLSSSLRWRDHFDRDHPERLRSAGQVAYGAEVRIVDPDGAVLKTGETGEIAIKSPILMSGYLNNPEATRDALRDGWMMTGDAGYLDDEGFLFVVDRVKDMIKTGGENVFSVEVERALSQHPAVREAAVIGVPSEKWGESVHAVIVLRDGAETTAEDLIAHCRPLIGGYKIPRTFDISREPLPLTVVGKVQKAALRDRYREAIKA